MDWPGQYVRPVYALRHSDDYDTRCDNWHHVYCMANTEMDLAYHTSSCCFLCRSGLCFSSTPEKNALTSLSDRVNWTLASSLVVDITVYNLRSSTPVSGECVSNITYGTKGSQRPWRRRRCHGRPLRRYLHEHNASCLDHRLHNLSRSSYRVHCHSSRPLGAPSAIDTKKTWRRNER